MFNQPLATFEATIDGNPATGEEGPIRDWFRDRLPWQRFVHFGLSGATLLYDALRAQPRGLIVLPAFICPELSAMAIRAGKRVVHIDADRRTLLPDTAHLEGFLAGQDASDTILLVDHSFGYPFPDLMLLRHRFPKLLIIEDCARALGIDIAREFPGKHSDWVLFSMYKTIPGSNNGAVLLTNKPIPIRNGGQVSATFRERIATISPLRYIYYELQRHKHLYLGSEINNFESFPDWVPTYGFPNRLCMARFLSALKSLETRAAIHRCIAQEITEALSQNGIECIKPSKGLEPAGHFVSFRNPSRRARNELLAALNRKGLFIQKTWDVVPAHYRAFAGTFASGHVNSQDLAEHMAHIRVRLYSSRRLRQCLGQEICKFYRNEKGRHDRSVSASV